jgi:hypothetical protein
MGEIISEVKSITQLIMFYILTLLTRVVNTTVYKTVMQPGALICAEVSLFMRRMQFTLSLKTFYEEIDM